MFKSFISIVFICVFCQGINAQLFDDNSKLTYEDTLRGSNTQYRDWWNVTHYEISVKPDFNSQFILGQVHIDFDLNDNYNGQTEFQIDLQNPLKITKINLVQFNSAQNDSTFIDLRLTKDYTNAHMYSVPTPLDAQQHYQLIIYYEGKPRVARNAPWDGGWIFTKDKNGFPWMSVACQGLGASAWFPCKDFQGDEPEQGATLNIATPTGLMGVGNGRLISEAVLNDDYHIYSWEVENPINNYNIVPNIGKYVNFKEEYKGEKGTLDCSFWVLDYNLEKAEKQFQQVQSMLQSFEYWMGPYPFYEDSYKLIESPYLGMEHQSGIAYGNHYKNGYLGKDLSGTGVGLKWDFIIIHESGHEWFGNNITTDDVADMWVQEGFTAYSETLYTESTQGKDDAFEYCLGTRRSIQNDKPVVGIYNVNVEGSGDMYYKTSNMIHTLRMLMKDDAKFRNMLRDMNAKYYHQTVTGQEIENYIMQYTGMDLTKFFDQYLRTTQIPILTFAKKKGNITYQYTNVVSGFAMPMQLENGEWIYPTEKWQKLKNYKNIPTINKNFLVIQK